MYRTLWDPSIGDNFKVLHQPENEHNHHAMAVFSVEDPGVIVGHIPREILRISHYFTRHDGKITGEVSGVRRHCREVGGMEIPCAWQFSGTARNIQILRRTLEDLALPTVSVIP